MGRHKIALDEFDIELGAHLRVLRIARGLTLVQVAAATALSHSFLSQIERGRARPSVNSLDRIAQALGSSHPEVVAAASRTRAPARHTAVYEHGTTDVLTPLEAPFAVLRIHYTTMRKGTYYRHPESEFLIVLRGIAAVQLGDADELCLIEGERLWFQGGTAHRWRAVDDAGFEILVIKEASPV